MATITINIPDNVLQRVVNGVAVAHGYQERIPDPANPDATIPNPQTRAQFAKAMLVKFVKDSVKQAEAIEAAEAARQQAARDADLINIT
jgi:hypothetical protein